MIVFIDHYVANFVRYVRTPLFDNFFIFVSRLGDTFFVVGITLLCVCIAYVFHRKYALTILGGSSLVALGATFLTKVGVARLRPEGAIIPLPRDYSFPSGHALISTVVYGIIGYYLYIHGPHRWIRVVGVICMIVPLLIGVSRVYVGVHWFSDVVAGWVMGGIMVIMTTQIIKKLT